MGELATAAPTGFVKGKYTVKFRSAGGAGTGTLSWKTANSNDDYDLVPGASYAGVAAGGELTIPNCTLKATLTGDGQLFVDEAAK